MYSALVLIPMKRNMHSELKSKIVDNITKIETANTDIDLTVIFDYRKEPSQPTDSTPWSKVTRVRNKLLATINIERYTHIVWIDADIITFSCDSIISRLINTNPEGITAPMVFVEDGSDAGKFIFYDVCGFIEKGGVASASKTIDYRSRVPGINFSHNYPYWEVPPIESIVEVDNIGAMYSVNTDIYMNPVVSSDYDYFKLKHTDHPAFTDHFAICEQCRLMGRKVVVNRNLEVFHANLPKYGEAWH